MNKPRETRIIECGTRILKDFSYENVISYNYLEKLIGYDKMKSPSRLY